MRGTLRILLALPALCARAAEPAAGAPAAQPEAPPANPPAAAASLSLIDRMRLEAHGFASFGYLRTWENGWLTPDSVDGTTQFQEAALNVVARPVNRLRVGAQLFERDLGVYDNGHVYLDWAYADYQLTDTAGVAVGRVKVPFGLYNEMLDVDSARTSIFLPQMYGLRTRDFWVSVDGGKAYGALDLGGAGRLEATAYLGTKHFDHESATLQYLSELGFGQDLELEAGYEAGGIVHWTTPVPNVGLRLSWAHLDDFTGVGDGPGGTTIHSRADYDFYAASLIWDPGPVTLVAELAPIHGRGESVVEPVGATRAVMDDGRYGYVAATWHALPLLDCYVAFDASYADGMDPPKSLRWVGAVAVRPTPHLTLKAEGQLIDGTNGLLPSDNPDGAVERWQVLAFKATVDF